VLIPRRPAASTTSPELRRTIAAASIDAAEARHRQAGQLQCDAPQLRVTPPVLEDASRAQHLRLKGG
jgi:hypothetical protein